MLTDRTSAQQRFAGFTGEWPSVDAVAAVPVLSAQGLEDGPVLTGGGLCPVDADLALWRLSPRSCASWCLLHPEPSPGV